MIAKLERVVVAVDDLDEAIVDYGHLLGRGPATDPEEERGLFVLRNTILQLVDRESTEIAGEPAKAGVAALVFQEDGRDEGDWLDLDETRRIPIGLSRDDREAPSLARETVEAAETISALDHVVISTGDLDAARALYGDRLQMRLALDREFPKRGIQILFFRVGGTTVEVVGALPVAGEKPRQGETERGLGSFEPERDRFGGLAWEVEDVAAIHGRLVREGFDVSDIRAGHKPGTSVCTVRDRTHGVPTLLKGPDRG